MDFQDDADNSFTGKSDSYSEADPSENVSKQPADDRTNPVIPSMRSTTASVSESIERIRKSISSQENLAGITLTILGLDQALSFTNQKQIIVGRLNPSTNEQPDVDLSAFPLNTTGISRKHIKIQEIDDSWYAEDLGSRNGTWLNGKLLMAYQRFRLRDGDQIRLGNITIIVLTHQVNLRPDDKSALATMEMTDTILISSSLLSGDQKGLNPMVIANMIAPFADALIEMMYLTDRIKKRSEREISVHRFEFVDQIVALQFTCRHEILEFLTHHQFESVQIDGNTETSQVEESENIADQLARRFMDENFPQLSPNQSSEYQGLLVQSLERCINSEFYIIYN